jgi:phosphate transport system substrate-binding protein
VRKRRICTAAIVAAAVLGIAACGSSVSNSATKANASKTASASLGGAPSGSGGAKTLVGAGSTLVAPLVGLWQPVYLKQAGVTVTYGAIGSGGGIESITGRTVDFGASDAPLSSAQASACNGCLEIPWALAGIGIAYHVSGVPSGLHFTGPVLADIWLGKIRTWNDPAIQKLNPGVKLPSTAIVPVHRTDGSGDTYGFVNYEDRVSPAFAAKIGPPAVTVSWPGGIGGKGNSGVGAALASTNGSIAYITFAYVVENHFDYGLVQNAAGKFLSPSISTIEAAAAALKSVPSGGTQGVSIVDPPASASDAYPISTFTYILIPKATKSQAVVSALRQFVDWAVTTGQQYGPKLVFAPLPKGVVSADEATVALVK